MSLEHNHTMSSLSPPPDPDPPPAAPKLSQSISPILAAAVGGSGSQHDLSPSASSVEVGHTTTIPRISQARISQHAALGASIVPKTTLSTEGDGIEMDSLRHGGSSGGDSDGNTRSASSHRRRRSSLINDSAVYAHAGAGAPGSSNGWPRQSQNITPRIKISEERFDGIVPTDADASDVSSGLSDGHLQDDEETGLTKQQRNRRKGKRKGHVQLDQRIARERIISADEKKEADQNVVRRLAINGILIALWYLFSLSISLVSVENLFFLLFVLLPLFSKRLATAHSISLPIRSIINGCSTMGN